MATEPLPALIHLGTFLDLYTYGYDIPKAYAIGKDGKIYDAFFAPNEDLAWDGRS
jgi:hypothetical protein